MLAHDQKSLQNDFVRLVAFHAADGQELNGALHSAAEETDAVVLVVPGKAKNFYSCVAGWLAPGLRRHGYDVLAVNTRDHDNPTAEGFAEAALDLQAAHRFCESLGYRRIVIIGVSFGVNKVLYYLGTSDDARRVKAALAGLALLAAGGIQASDPAQWERILSGAGGIDTPLFILQAEQDQFVQVPEKRADEIAKAVSSENQTRQTVTGANHYFHEHGDEVVAATAGWLDSLKLVQRG